MSVQPSREVRFAVVLYGGVSLAIYMNGISQELLRMVRGSSGLIDDDLDEVEAIYRDLSEKLTGKAGERTKFVIDIISGTSAGGINGVALAKALVTGCENLNTLRDAWLNDADIDRLFNKAETFGRGQKRLSSLLDGRHMFDILLRTLSAMKPAKGKSQPLTEMMDLFVTATDLEGRVVPIQLTGETLDERIHKAVFHFAFDSGAPGSGVGFDGTTDPLLAFAARCTSSFPVAFPPMRYMDIPEAQRPPLSSLRRVFEGFADHPDRQFADGGYLDNRPFSHAIDLIPFRPTTLPGERKLLFVDPFPEPPPPEEVTLSGAKTVPRDPPDFDFLQNAKLGATTLPRREIIREDLQHIIRQNARLDRLATLQDRWERDREQLQAAEVDLKEPEKPSNLQECDLIDFMRLGYGETYPLYHHLRVYDTTDALSELAAHLAGFNPKSDETLYMRQILRAWREAHFSAYRMPDHETEMAYLSRYDVYFRLRRMVHLRARVDAKLRRKDDADLRELRRSIEAELAHLRRLGGARQALAAHFLTSEEITDLTARISDSFRSVMQFTNFKRRYNEAKAVYEEPLVRALVDKAMAGIGNMLRQGFDESSERVWRALEASGSEEFKQIYKTFHWHDVTTLPFLDGSDAEEHSAIQVFRISPADSALNPDPSKLAGIAVGAFGGFLDRDWREHDMLWGRLDGAERIVTALLPDPEQRDLRQSYIDRLQEAILAQEYGAEHGRDRRLALLRTKLAKSEIGDESLDDLASRALGITEPPPMGLERFRTHYRAIKPMGPAARKVAGWCGTSASLLSRMIDDLPDKGALRLFGNRLSSGLRTGGVLTTNFIRFAMPGSFRRLQADNLLLLTLFAGLVLVGLAAISGKFPLWIGGALVAASLLLWLALYMLGRVLRGRTPLPQAARQILAIIALALIMVGAWRTLQMLGHLLR